MSSCENQQPCSSPGVILSGVNCFLLREKFHCYHIIPSQSPVEFLQLSLMICVLFCSDLTWSNYGRQGLEPGSLDSHVEVTPVCSLLA